MNDLSTAKAELGLRVILLTPTSGLSLPLLPLHAEGRGDQLSEGVVKLRGDSPTEKLSPQP